MVAFCGSDNGESWLTDLDTIVLGNKGPFIAQTLALVNSPLLKKKYMEGFRITATGHSLGGFLCQVLLVFFCDLVLDIYCKGVYDVG